jgi:hypothetical protein
MRQTKTSSAWMLVGISFLTGCVSKSLVMPSAESLASDQVAFLKIDRTVRTGELRPELNAIYDLAGNTLLPSRGFHDYYKIKIAPGTYRVQLKIYSVNYTPSYPVVAVRAEAGKTYLFTSSIAMNGKAVRAEVLPILTSADTTPDK